jgi:hypothetical protein
VTSQLSAALRAAAAVIHPDEAAAGLIISHAAFLARDDFTRHIETAACASDGTPMAWINRDAVITSPDSGRLPASGGEKRIVQIAASLAAGRAPDPDESTPRNRPCGSCLACRSAAGIR